MSDARVLPGRAAAEVNSESITGYAILVVAMTFMCNVFFGEETRALSLGTPLILKEFGVTPKELGFIQTVGAWVGIIGTVGIPMLADWRGRRPAFLSVLLLYTILAP